MELLVNGLRAFCYTGGRPFDATLPTVMFVHGGELDHSVWGLQSRYLAHHGRSVLAVDLPGHGRSEGDPLATIGAMSEWIVAVLDAAGVARAALVGHSMGSLIAVDAAARFASRVDRIALLGTTFPMRVSAELLEAAKNDEPRAQAMINVWSHAAIAHYPNNPGPGFWIHGGNLRLMQRQKPGVLHADFNACNAYADGATRAADVTCPTLLMLGRRDAMTPSRGGRGFAKAFGKAAAVQVVELDGAGHNLMAERPDEVLDALIGFVPDAG